MRGIELEQVATDDSFDEAGYLQANPDVAQAVSAGHFTSGHHHFDCFGRNEGRRQRNNLTLLEAKASKREKILGMLRADMPHADTGSCLDFLTDELRQSSNVIDTNKVSSNSYREESLTLIDKHQDGCILDCGAGMRKIYYDNVVNFEIADYDTTDVRGVGEMLPFKDNSFDAVFSLAVLEHVRDPFLCAREISRVLKPGGDLLCTVPFLQPMHGYPNHYFNATQQGIRELFEQDIDIHTHKVRKYDLPIWSLTWVLNSWADGLKGEALEEFLAMTVADLRNHPETYLDRKFVSSLSDEKNFELAAGTCIIGTKR